MNGELSTLIRDRGPDNLMKISRNPLLLRCLTIEGKGETVIQIILVGTE
jgi:hypothetical protein